MSNSRYTNICYCYLYIRLGDPEARFYPPCKRGNFRDSSSYIQRKTILAVVRNPCWFLVCTEDRNSLPEHPVYSIKTPAQLRNLQQRFCKPSKFKTHILNHNKITWRFPYTKNSQYTYKETEQYKNTKEGASRALGKKDIIVY